MGSRERFVARGRLGRRAADDSGLRRIDALAASPTEEAADVWLSWELTPLSAGTHVRLVLDELEPGPEPIEELVIVLDMLAERSP